MTDEKWKTLQGLKDELFRTKDEASFNEAVNKIGAFVKENDMTEAQKQKLRDYTNNLKQKKKDWWEKQMNKPAYTPKSSYIFREDEGKAFVQLCNALAAYLTQKTNDSDEK